MSFLSVTFLGFFGIVLLIYYIVPKKVQWYILLSGSYIFYLCAGYQTFIFILFTTGLTWFAGLWFGKVNEEYIDYLDGHKGLDKYEKRKIRMAYGKKKKGMLICLLAANFGLLFVLKYFHMIAGIGQLFSDIWHMDQIFAGVQILLPLGISYYTFQAAGYSIDVYRNKYPPEKNLAKYALFIAFFPQLVQGPISRYDELEKQLYQERRFHYRNVTYGFQLMLWGYFKKLVIGVRLTAIVSTIMTNPRAYQGIYLLIASYLGWLELYIDFSSGVDIARGVAQAFGIELPQNFQQPFFAESVGEFWRRWHISLNNWWRDYIFYPLTLSKAFNHIGKFFKTHFSSELGKKMPVFFALIIVRVLNSLWHGANSVYLVSGIYHGILVGMSFLMEQHFEKINQMLHIHTQSRGWKIFKIWRTYTLLSVPRIMNYCSGMKDAWKNIRYLFAQWNVWIIFDGSFYETGIKREEICLVILALVVVFAVDYSNEKGRAVRDRIAGCGLMTRWLIYYALIFGILIFGAYGAGYDAADFMYANF